MSSLTDEDLVLISGYLTNHSTGDKSYFWAYEEIAGMEDPERLWRLMLEMIRITTDAGTLAYIAAGPLEELLKHYGNQFIERVENLARTDPHFREALTSVYDSGFTPEVSARVRKASNKKLNT